MLRLKRGHANYEMDMCTGPLVPKIIRYSLPLMLTGILQLLYNAADIIVVGRFVGDTALAAVSSTGSLINLPVRGHKRDRRALLWRGRCGECEQNGAHFHWR